MNHKAERRRSLVPSVDEGRFVSDIYQNDTNRLILGRLLACGLKDAWLVAGCLFQTVWNVQTGRPPHENIQDYDIFYFDNSDLSAESEKRTNERVSALLGAGTSFRVDLCNQARVHLWYGNHFGGEDYAPLQTSHEGVDRFLINCTRVGVQPNGAESLRVYAPCGFEELYEGGLSANPANHRPSLFEAKVKSYQARWPWLTPINVTSGSASPEQLSSLNDRCSYVQA